MGRSLLCGEFLILSAPELDLFASLAALGGLTQHPCHSSKQAPQQSHTKTQRHNGLGHGHRLVLFFVPFCVWVRSRFLFFSFKLRRRCLSLRRDCPLVYSSPRCRWHIRTQRSLPDRNARNAKERGSSGVQIRRGASLTVTLAASLDQRLMPNFAAADRMTRTRHSLRALLLRRVGHRELLSGSLLRVVPKVLTPSDSARQNQDRSVEESHL